MNTLLTAMRRIRIRSWKDLVMIIVAALLAYVIEAFCESKFGWDEKKSKPIAGLIVVIFVVIWLLAVGE